MTRFEQAVLDEVARIRGILNSHDLPRFHFEISAEGRVLDGDVKIKFGLGEYGATVTGNSIEAVLTEFSRRRGWEARNDGLALPFLNRAQNEAPVSAQAEDEIPY